MPCPPHVNVLGEDGAVAAVGVYACASMQASAVSRQHPTPLPTPHQDTQHTYTGRPDICREHYRHEESKKHAPNSRQHTLAVLLRLQASVAAFSSRDQSVIPYKKVSINGLLTQHSIAQQSTWQHTCTLGNHPGPFKFTLHCLLDVTVWFWVVEKPHNHIQQAIRCEKCRQCSVNE